MIVCYEAGLPREFHEIRVARHVVVRRSLTRATHGVRKVESRGTRDEFVFVIETRRNVLQLTH